jgi:hypothetical protein
MWFFSSYFENIEIMFYETTYVLIFGRSESHSIVHNPSPIQLIHHLASITAHTYNQIGHCVIDHGRPAA